MPTQFRGREREALSEATSGKTMAFIGRLLKRMNNVML
jgi:hypothetical protein